VVVVVVIYVEREEEMEEMEEIIGGCRVDLCGLCDDL